MNLHRLLHPHGRGHSNTAEIHHWKDLNELHVALHRFPGYFKAILLELMEQPLPYEALTQTLNRLKARVGRRHKHSQIITERDLAQDLSTAVERGILENAEGMYRLSPAGQEMAAHMQEAIPSFFSRVFSANMVSLVTIIVHVALSICKVGIGALSQSAGLIADGIDNTADTLSAILVWVGIRFDRERLASLLIIAMMFLSVGGVTITCVKKFLHPQPIAAGMLAFIISAGCGLTMLVLSIYQYVTGKRISNFAIMCQAVDSRNHVLTSLLVCGGILLSYLANNIQAAWGKWFFYADAVASAIIGLLILQSAIELCREWFKPQDEPAQISHFWTRVRERANRRIVFDWVAGQVKETALTQEQLETRFFEHFCEQTPKILRLSGMGYSPDTPDEFNAYLEDFVNKHLLSLEEGKYIRRQDGET